ncbi:Exosome complex exonuclease rrp4 [Spraguea lophii 42_110]|uniref:Exosome complex exonuclease rrp4 n=1 Tax=Spraguea lophii (strain 42_110) TaxID=1358809 RepID=S7WAM2_SPRLO|nr:Exosome complex exonuclease rrp4 [Spraguea lophii 42_110]
MERIVIPGEYLLSADGYISGYGTTVKENNIISTVYGTLCIINKLVTVNYEKYKGDVGDVVVGRVERIVANKWILDLNGKEGILNLSGINLPGGVQRRKLESDEMRMKEFFDEGDVVVGEVQSAKNNIVLHTRNSMYRKLRFGILKKISLPIKKFGKYFFTNERVNVIVGKNGFIFIEIKNNEGRKFISKINNYLDDCEKNKNLIEESEINKILNSE